MHLLVVLALFGNLWYETHDVDIRGHTGRIAIRMYVPTVPRYIDGSPVVVTVQGGFSFRGFQNPLDLYHKFGITFITFLFPGGVDPSSGRTSDGIYDARGPNCLVALYDVLRFAHGDLSDTGGRKITDITEFPVDTSVVGMVAFSNGGNLTVNVLDFWGDSLGFVDYLVNWESPTSSQIILSELGGRDCDSARDGNGNGFFNDDRVNPHYLAYGDTSCAVDYSRLRYDSSFPPDSAVFLDGNGNNSLDLIHTPCTWEDVNNNGVIDYGEDFRLSRFHYPGMSKWFYSREATYALDSILTSWPSIIATPVEADTFWWWREAVMHFDNAALKVPGIKVMLIFSEDDHVQATLDKAHIHQAYAGWRRNGIWVRLNPDEAYTRDIHPPIPPGGPDNPANTAPTNWNLVNSWAVPEIYNSLAFAAAGVAEMCDRVKFNVWTNDLSAIISPPKPVLNFNFGIHIEEVPKYFKGIYLNEYADRFEAFAETLRNHGAILANQFDWVLIEALEHYRPGFLANLESMGHEVTPHGHETVYSLREIKILLDEAGVSNPNDGNGHFLASYWPDYLALHVGTPHASYNKLVYTSQNMTNRLVPWRPYVDTLSRRWLTHDSTGPLVFVCNYGVPGDIIHHDSLTRGLLLTASHAFYDRVNSRSCFIHYIQEKDSIPMLTDSASVALGLIDSLVARGVIHWTTMDEIYNQYLSWESSHPGVNPLTDTFTVSPPDTTHYTAPTGWTYFTEWSDTTAGIPVLPNNVVTSLALDREGKLWVGTLGGLAIFDGLVWRWITPDHSTLPAWYIRTIIPQDSVVWVGTDYGGLVKMTLNGHVIRVYDTTGGTLPSVGIHSIFVAHDSSIWVGMFHGGVAVLDHGTWNYYTTADGLPDDDVFSIAELNDTIYVGTSGGGVAYFDGTRFHPLPTIGSGGIGGNYVHALTVHNGRLYAGTYGYGVVEWNGSWNLIGPDTTSRNPLGVIYPHGLKFVGETLFAATYNGVIWKLPPSGPSDLLPIPSNGNGTENPYTFVFDSVRNILWVGTLRGVKAFNPSISVEEDNSIPGPELIVTYKGIRAYLPQTGKATIEIFDVSGRKVWSQKVRGEGWHTVYIPQVLKSGVYLVKMRAGKVSAFGKFVKVR